MGINVRTVVEAVLDDSGGSARGGGTAGSLVGGGGGEAGLLGGLVLRLVLDEELEEVSGLVLGEGVLELVDGRRDLQALEDDLLLALEAHVGRPLDHAADLTGGL